MFKNYFKIALRNFWRHKVFSLINVLGLAIGISASLVIYLIVHYEFTFDRFEKDGDRIYGVSTDMKFAGNTISFAGVPSPLPDAARSEMTGLDGVAGFHLAQGGKVTVQRTQNGTPVVFKNQPDIIFADSNYFRLIPYKWLAGSPQTSLNAPFRVVLTEERAKAYFPSMDYADVIGKQIVYDDSITTAVSGVVQYPRENTNFIFKEFISNVTIPGSGLKDNYGWENWGSVNTNSQMFIKVAKGRSRANIKSQLMSLLHKYNKDAMKGEKNSEVFNLQPLSEMHFSDRMGSFGHTANKPTLYGLLAIAAFLLLLGCFNFINLTTAQSVQRAKEIGIRKTMGSSISQLILQFLSETFFTTCLATILSIALIPLLLKVFADFIPSDLHFDLLHQPNMILFLTGLIVVVSLFAGFYPALVLSRYKPVLVLKNQAYTGTANTRKAFLRKGLTVTQFVIAQFFIMATAITVKQIHYMLNKDMGFKKNAIIFFSAPLNANNFDKGDPRRFVLLNELKSIPGIDRVSLGEAPPSSVSWSIRTFDYKDGKKDVQTEVCLKSGDTNYLPLYNIKLLAGRNIEQSDTVKEYVINETYMHMLGFQKPQDALNKELGGKPIVGVIADFNQQSLHAPIKPLAFSSSLKNDYVFHIALQPQVADGQTWKATISQVEKSYKQIYPEEDFSYQFFDESIAKFYESEQNISTLLQWATGLAILISCMGLLGLAIFTTNTRTKEIGVRKVLGASVAGIVSLLSRDFILLVLLAFVIAAPIAWIAMHKWIENFAYRTTLSYWVFGLSGIGMVLIALITLSFQTVRSARANPVESLRTE